MYFSKQHLLLIACIIHNNVHASAAINLMRDISLIRHPSEHRAVHPQCSQAAQEAQQALGIAPENYASANKHVAGYVQDIPVLGVFGRLFINEQELQKMDPGTQRFYLASQASRNKHHEFEKAFTIYEATFLAGFLATNKLLKKCNVGRARWIGAYFSGIFAASVALTAYTKNIRHTTEREGLLATNCHTCAHKAIAYRQHAAFVSRDPLHYDHYLEPAQLEEIAQELKGKTCEHHAPLQNS